MGAYQNPVFEYVRSPDQDAPAPVRHAVAVVGAGPVGLAAAIDLAQHGLPTVLLDDDGTVSVGSRSVCYARRTLEIFDRLGCGERVARRGVGWNAGRVYFQDSQVYSFTLMPEPGNRRPAFVNLQQYYLEEILLEQARATGKVDLRWKSKVVDLRQDGPGVALRIETPDGAYDIVCDWVVVCDGARSPLRQMMGLECRGEVVRDRFLVADVLMDADYPVERWFWFDPPFHANHSALLHRQADNVWRIDLQLGWDADPDEERRPERVVPRLRQMLGDREFELLWVGVYSFACRRMERLRHGRVLFAGDAAHQMSPFGARGTNSGIQDADNLGWKLAMVASGTAPETLLDSYSDERVAAADENLLHAARSTEFITPKSRMSRTFRDAVLLLARNHPFARRMVNSGRLSVPAVLSGSALNTADGDPFAGPMTPGAPAADAPVVVNGELRWLLECLGNRFNGMYFAHGMSVLPGEVAAGIASLTLDRIPVETRVVVEPGNPIELPPGVMKLEDYEDLAAQRYDAGPGTFYLLRPDQHVCARWRAFGAQRARGAVLRATCNDTGRSA
jgi:3-(3-hydroxy-phenyl)propionate hydroxylase